MDYRKFNCALCDGWGKCDRLIQQGFRAREHPLEEEYVDKLKRRKEIYLSVAVGLTVVVFLQAIVIPRTALPEFLVTYVSGIMLRILEYCVSIVTGIISGLITYFIIERKKINN